MNVKNHCSLENFIKPIHNYRYSSIRNDIQLCSTNNQITIHRSREGHQKFLYSASSSIFSVVEHVTTTRSLCTLSDDDDLYCPDNSRPRSYSQPPVYRVNDELLLEHVTDLHESPVPDLHFSHRKPCGIVLPNNLSFFNEFLHERSDPSNSSTMSLRSFYRVVFIRSIALVFLLASLFSTEVLQTSIYTTKHSLHSLLALHVSSSIAALLFAQHASYIQMTRHHWTISDVRAYDRWTQILIIFATILSSTWIVGQCFHSLHATAALISACIAGVSLSCIIIKTFDHLLQLSMTLPIENIKLLTKHVNIFILIYNSICQFALLIGGVWLLCVILFMERKNNSSLISSKPYELDSRSSLNNQSKNDKDSIPSRNLTCHPTEKEQGNFHRKEKQIA